LKKNIFEKFIVAFVATLILIIPTNHFAQAQSPELLTILNPTPETSDAFGWGASLDGNMVVIGAPTDDLGAVNSGAAHLFDTSGNLLRTFNNPTPGIGDLFGIAVSISGNKIIIGTFLDDVGISTNAGSAFLFDATTGNLLQTFNSPEPNTGDLFGRSVSISGNNILIGAPFDDTGAQDAGIAYLFDATTGSLLQTFTNPTPGNADLFGHLVSISGNNVVIGADGDNTGVHAAGSVYLFDATTGTLLRTFVNPNPNQPDRFGTSVNISGNNILIGAPFDDTGAQDAGIAYLFDATTGSLLQTFTNPNPGNMDLFGFQGSISGNTVVLSAINDNTGAVNAGIAYLFDIATGNLLRIYSNPTPESNDNFGTIVAMSNNNVLIGAPGDNTGAQNSGSAYLIFEPTTDSDGDKIPNVLDNCINISNQGQEDIDNDRIGDVCDPLHLISKDTAINTLFVIQTSQTMQITPNIILNNFDKIIVAGTLNNAGIINNQPNTRLINIGTGIINNNVGGTITNVAGSVILNDSGGIIENNSGDSIINSGVILNVGNSIINNHGPGKITNNNGGLILNQASIINNYGGGKIESNTGSFIINYGVGGTINNNSGGDISNNGGSVFLNISTLNNAGSITNNDAGSILFNIGGGSTNNNSGGTMTNAEAGTIIYNGIASTLTNNAGGIIDNGNGGNAFNECGGFLVDNGIVLGTIIQIPCI